MTSPYAAATGSGERDGSDGGLPRHATDVLLVAAHLDSDAVHGLGGAAADQRLVTHGPNELVSHRRDGWVVLLRRQLTSPMIALLAAAAVLSAVLGDTTEAAVICGVVVLNTIIGFRQEHRARTAMASLQAMSQPVAVVVRDGATSTVAARVLVPGDLVRLEAGARVPADGRIVEAHALRVHEGPLTGESVPADKAVWAVHPATPLAERTSMAYAGTTVTTGRGTMLVTATGMQAELGRIAGMLQRATPGHTPLQHRLDVLVRRLALLVAAVVGVVTVVGVVQGEAVDRLVLTAVSLAIAAVPESLPAVVTITLAIGAQRMLRRRALVRHLYAVETLGSVTAVCSDKTGTLTRNEMVVAVVETGAHRVDVAAGPAVESRPLDVELLLTAGVLANDATWGPEGGGGDPTEVALLAVARRLGIDDAELREALPRVGELPFDAQRKRMTTFHDLPAAGRVAGLPGRVAAALAAPGGRIAVTKGALDGLLDCCETVLTPTGPVDLDAARRAVALATGERLAADGQRVLGFAVRVWRCAGDAQEDLASESAMMLLGVQAMIDPPREGVAAAIALCRSAGIRTLMITGDHPLTALAVARTLGIAQAGDEVVTGADMGALDDDALVPVVRSSTVYARVSPEDKLRIVRALQRDGDVVSMTGDGVNDAPALEQADIGVAMGVTGTDVSKDAADVVLQDDDFSTIVSAVREGRVVFDNIRKFIRNILSGNLAEVAVMLLAPAIGMPLPLLPLQILWLNLATDGLPAMALAVEQEEPGVMLRPPTPLRESLFGADRGRRILVRGAVLTVLTLVPAYLLWRSGDPAWQTVLFTSIAFAELAGGFAMRSETRPLWRLGVLTNRALVGAVALTVSLQVLVVTVPPVRDVLGLRSLSASHWLLAVAVALAYLVAVEVDKAVQRPVAAEPDPAGTG